MSVIVQNKRRPVRKTSATRPRVNRTLQALRLNEGLSPNDLAYRAGVSGNTVRMAEAGFTPTPRVQFAIAGVFKDAQDRPLRPLDIWPLERQR